MLEIATAAAIWCCVFAWRLYSKRRSLNYGNAISARKILCYVGNLNRNFFTWYRMAHEDNATFVSSNAVAPMCDCSDIDVETITDLHRHTFSPRLLCEIQRQLTRVDYRFFSLEV
jgi:hypothetical protein